MFHRMGRAIGVALAMSVAYAGLSCSSARSDSAATGGAGFSIASKKLVLSGRYDEIRLLADFASSYRSVRDVTEKTRFSVEDPTVAETDRLGVLRGKRDGKTFVIARFGGSISRSPLIVTGFSNPVAPRFTSDVLPILTKTGCNMGGCHGAGAGKGGLKLSLQGYDPDLDYEAITRAAGARRISPAQPENSLLLRKPTFAVFHKGGQRFALGSSEYRILKDWIAAGTPAPAPSEPRVVALEVPLPVRTLAPGQTQNYALYARFSDGSRRDVTGRTLFTASDETVASVSPDGKAKVNGAGESSILMRYQGLVAAARIVSPYPSQISAPRTSTSGRVSRLVSSTLKPSSNASPGSALSKAVATPIDRLVEVKLEALGLTSSPRCSDSDFIRRSTLDVIGLLPTNGETRTFLANPDPLKRTKWIDSLLNRPEYVDYWTLRWGDTLRSSRRSLGDKGMNALNLWIREGVAQNKPWNQFAKELLLAQGSAFRNGEANFYRSATTPQTLAETTSQVFLGVRIQCAKCHNHPYEKWTQNQYFQMAAFFSRVSNKSGERKDEPVIFLAGSGEVTHPKTGKQVVPCALDSAPLEKGFEGDRRAVLADWLVSPRNPFFAKAAVNRIWKHFLGRGFVEPEDDLRVTNPPSNAPLFEYLSEEFVRNGFDLKRLMRSILLSETYQRSPETTKNNERDSKFHSHFAFKRLDAEPMLDALNSVTGAPDKFEGLPAGTRATQLPDPAVASYFLDLFGRPARTISCACERSDAPNLGQTLHLMNNAGINSRLSAKTGRIATLIEAKTSDSKLIDELYLATYSRFPTASESKQGVTLLAKSKNRQQTSEDLLWALFNSKEFLFNH